MLVLTFRVCTDLLRVNLMFVYNTGTVRRSVMYYTCILSVDTISLMMCLMCKRREYASKVLAIYPETTSTVWAW